jgi:hypothetical protein
VAQALLTLKVIDVSRKRPEQAGNPDFPIKIDAQSSVSKNFFHLACAFLGLACFYVTMIRVKSSDDDSINR